MIHFNEELHKYTDDEGNTYISVTQLISLYKQPFDTIGISKRYAEKNGETAEYWQNKWENMKNEACDRGTLFHNDKEDTLLGRGVDINTRGEAVPVNNPAMSMRIVQDLYDLPDGLYPELRMWHAGYRLAGTGDKVFIQTLHTHIGSNRRLVDIDDHKTNKKIYTKSWAPMGTTNHKMMLGPVSHLMDCNFVHYELQISFYAYMMECEGYTIRNLQFTHYPHPNPENPLEEIEPVVYVLKYRRDEVIAILEDYRRNKRKK